MSTATPTTRDRTTAKAPQLKGWLEVFRAGTHTDSKGVEFKASTDDLDQIVANHALGSVPVVIGHPKTNGPAWAWTDGLRREGESLFAAFRDIHPAFDDAVALGSYRNRSVKIVNDKKVGLRLRHVGWLGAEPPALDGLMPDAVEFSADDDGAEAFEFSVSDDVLSGFAWAMDGMAELLRGLRDWVIESSDVQTADRVMPTYRIDSLVRQAQEARDALQRDRGATFSHQPPTGDQSMTITQAQLDAAVAAAEKKGRDEASSEFSAKDAELTALRAQKKTDRIDAKVKSLLASGRLLPAKEAEFRAVADQLIEAGGGTFEFAAADGTKKDIDLFDAVHEFMSQQNPLVKLGGQIVKPGDEGKTLDVNDARAVQQAAHEFQASEKEAGRDISYIAAVEHVTNPVQA